MVKLGYVHWVAVLSCSSRLHLSVRFMAWTMGFVHWHGQVYCPINSSTTLQVPAGYYPTGTVGQRSGITLCPAGSYCSGGSVYPCASGRVGASLGAANSLCDAPCPAGISFYSDELERLL